MQKKKKKAEKKAENKEKKIRRSQYDSYWKDEPFKHRNVLLFYSFKNEEDREEFNKFEKTCRNGVNYFSSILLQGLKDGRWSLKDVGKKNFQDVLRKAEECIEFFARFNLTVPRVQRSVCSLAIRFYKGYKQRNKKLPKRAPFLKENKAMFFCDGVISGLQYYGDDGKKKRLKSVVYDEVKKNNKYELKSESSLELNKLIAFLKSSPNVSIEIGGHTDSNGDTKSNLTLSENRAKAVYDFLIQNGIAATKLSYKGFGSTLPIADNSTEEGRAQNRRTEFKIK